MIDLAEALRRAAARPITHPSLAELRAELGRRHRRRRVGGVMAVMIVVVGIVGTAMLRPLPDGGRVVRAAGDSHSSETTVQAPGARVGDGFCGPQLTNAGFRIAPPTADAVPAQTKAAVLELARSLPGTGTGSYDGFFASVRNPLALKQNPGAADTPRPTWVVEASDVIPPTRSTAVNSGPGSGGATANVDRSGPLRMVVFVDDATLTSVGIFGDCEDAPAVGDTGTGPPKATAVTTFGAVTLSAAGYCWTAGEASPTGTGRGQCSAGPGDGQSLRVGTGERLTLGFSSAEAPRDLAASVIKTSSDPGTDQQFLAVSGTNPATILVAVKPGSYKLNIDGRWSQGSASYAVILEVVDGPASAEPSAAPPTTTCVYLSAAAFTCNLAKGRIVSSTP